MYSVILASETSPESIYNAKISDSGQAGMTLLIVAT